MKRLAVARLWHEGNSFSPVPTPLAAFQAREWVEGDAARAFYRGTATEMGAAVGFAETVEGWTVRFLRCAAAPPGGPVPDADYRTLRDAILAGLEQGPWDAVYLSLHGALVTDADPAPELDLLRAVRQRIGRTPLAVSFDLHANIGAEHVGLIDLAAGYKTYPHVDMAETADKLLRQLVALAEGRLAPKGAIVKLPLILPSFNMRTTDGPMAEVAARARASEAAPHILDATVFGGFAYGDSPHAGAAAMVFADRDAERPGLVAAELARALEERAGRFFIRLPGPAEALSMAAAEGSGTVALLDPADNPLSGGIGDTPGLLRALLEAQAPVPALFAFFWDPGLVARAHREGLAARLRVRLGARLTDRFGPPVEGEATVLKLTDGCFRNRGPMERNLPVGLGRTALLEMAGIRIIVTETCQTPNDPGYFDLHGIDLAAVRLLCVKAKNHFRAAFAPLCRHIIDVDLPGPAALDLRRLPYRHLPPGVRRSAP
ncbi:MAG: M81 family metallopeptidase [Pseudomonadota bacterium]